jgi:hypothetical protein
MSAANKLGTMLFRLVNSNDPKYSKYSKFSKQDSIKMIMRETTRGSARATFYYKVERTELPKPITRTLPDGTVIVNKYKTKTRKCGDNDSDIKKMEEAMPAKPVKKVNKGKMGVNKKVVSPPTNVQSDKIVYEEFQNVQRNL